MGLSIGMIILLVFFVIVVIIMCIMIGLYVSRNNQLYDCQNKLKSCQSSIQPTPAPTPAPTPNPNNGKPWAFAAGTIKGEEITLTCPAGKTIKSYDVLTRIVDSKKHPSPESLNGYVSPIGHNTYKIIPSKLLKEAGISYQHSEECGTYPTQVVYGYYTCG